MARASRRRLGAPRGGLDRGRRRATPGDRGRQAGRRDGGGCLWAQPASGMGARRRDAGHPRAPGPLLARLALSTRRPDRHGAPAAGDSLGVLDHRMAPPSEARPCSTVYPTPSAAPASTGPRGGQPCVPRGWSERARPGSAESRRAAQTARSARRARDPMVARRQYAAQPHAPGCDPGMSRTEIGPMARPTEAVTRVAGIRSCR